MMKSILFHHYYNQSKQLFVLVGNNSSSSSSSGSRTIRSSSSSSSSSRILSRNHHKRILYNHNNNNLHPSLSSPAYISCSSSSSSSNDNNNYRQYRFYHKSSPLLLSSYTNNNSRGGGTGGGRGGGGRGGGGSGGGGGAQKKNTRINTFRPRTKKNVSSSSPNTKAAANYYDPTSVKHQPKTIKQNKRRKGLKIEPVLLPSSSLDENTDDYDNADDYDYDDKDIPQQFGPLAAESIREIKRKYGKQMTFYNPPTSFLDLKNGKYKNHNYNNNIDDDDAEEELRVLDYFLSEPGSTEDIVGERRILAHDTIAERERFHKLMDEVVDEYQLMDLGVGDLNKPIKLKTNKNKLLNQKTLSTSELFDLYSNRNIGGHDNDDWDDDLEGYETGNDSGSDDDDKDGDDDDDDDDDDRQRDNFDPNQLVHGEWSELLINVMMTSKMWRGGRLESYRALVIGGNANGCGGFGIGKSKDPILAVDIASRKCKKNIYFVDRYQKDGLTRDLVGKQNSCKLIIRATDHGQLRGNPLVREILVRFGITNAVSKAYGNRHPFNVVRATFKALMTHESIRDIALKRGKRILSIDRARRLQI